METYIKELEDHLRVAISKFKEELQGVRSGRPTTQLLENIQVEYAGQMLPIKQLASLSIKPPREIDITVWDPSIIAGVMKAIDAAKAGLSVQNEGNTIRAFLPPLTQERRDELTKFVKKMAEATRIQIRGTRDEMNKKVKTVETNKEFGEDAVFKAKEKIQKFVEDANGQIEALVEGKLKELQE